MNSDQFLLAERLFGELDRIALIDPHTHISPHQPASATLADILGYHYYTELAHSSGMPRAWIEEPGIDPQEKVRRLFEFLEPIRNTIQWSWFEELCRELYDWNEGPISRENWEALYDRSRDYMRAPNWTDQVMERSRLESVFLTNDFDDPLEGFDTRRFVPCLRTDELVFHLWRRTVRARFESSTGLTLAGLNDLESGIERMFVRFRGRGARACAISLPPDFSPRLVPVQSAAAALEECLQCTDEANRMSEDAARNLSAYVFWKLAEACERHGIPFDLMIGVRRRVYPGGVFQGQDLFDSRVSLIQYADLFNAFPTVMFPISVLASVTNQELVAFSWIFPNVVTHGHWWYSNTPSFIARDLPSRLEAIPRTKQIGYYSDMYKLEFALPKFRMYKRVLADVLARDFVVARNWSEYDALRLGYDLLRGNVERIFFSDAPLERERAAR